MSDDFLDQVRSALAQFPPGFLTSDPPEPVVERGETVLTLFRHGKREQLRVVLDEFCGQHFATVRIWFRDPEDRDIYRPTGRGVTIRRREFPQVLAALHDVAERLGVDVQARDSRKSGESAAPP